MTRYVIGHVSLVEAEKDRAFVKVQMIGQRPVVHEMKPGEKVEITLPLEIAKEGHR